MALSRISGTVEVLGRSAIEKGLTVYTYIRMLTDEGRVVTLENIGAYDTCDSYLRPGLKAVLYVTWFGQNNTIFAIRTAGRVVDGSGDIERMRQVHRTSAVIWTIIGIPASFLIIGIPLLGVGIVSAITFFKAPPLERLQAFLAQDDETRGVPALGEIRTA